MKRSTAILSVLLFSFLSYTYGVITVQYKTFPFEVIRTVKNILIGSSDSRSPKYFHKKSFFETFGQNDYDIVFIGDSITEGAEWEDIFPDYKIANRGVGGDTTSGILERIDSVVSTKANKAFIMVGINDFSKGVSTYDVFSNYKKIVEELKKNGFKVYIQSTILAGDRVSGLNSSIISLNKKLKDLTESDEKLTYIDLNKSLSGNGLLSEKFTQDDVHLNGSGYKAWKNTIKKYLQSE